MNIPLSHLVGALIMTLVVIAFVSIYIVMKDHKEFLHDMEEMNEKQLIETVKQRAKYAEERARMSKAQDEYQRVYEIKATLQEQSAKLNRYRPVLRTHNLSSYYKNKDII